MELSKIKTADILGVRVHRLKVPAAIRAINDLVADGKNHYIVTPNPEMVMYARKHEWFRNTLNNADLLLADGVGLRWAAQYLSYPKPNIPIIGELVDLLYWLGTGISVVLFPTTLNVVPERITGADMVWEIAKLCHERDYGVFLLGAGPGVALSAARIMQTLYPRLNVVEVMVGPPYEEPQEVIYRIQQTKPKFLFLAFPAPEQLRWFKEELPKLEGVTAMGIGGALDFIVGGTAMNAGIDQSPAKRAPGWMQAHGLEWLYRLITQPWRKGRIKNATIDFINTVTAYKYGRFQ